MKFRLTRERKIIFGVGVVLLMGGLIYNLLPALQGSPSDEEMLAVKQQRVIKYRAKLNAQSRLEARLQGARNRLRNAESGLLQAKTPALAAVDIQQVLTQIADKTEAEIKSMRILGSTAVAGEGYIAVPVEVTISSDIRQLVGVLYDIQNAPKLLRTKDIAIRSAGVRRGEKILTTLTVEGFMKKQEQDVESGPVERPPSG
jgi:hypothetical protein